VAEISNRGDLFRGVPRREGTYKVLDYVLRNGRIAGGSPDPVDIGVRDGRIAAIAPG
jgi:hypothetical protein